MRPRRVVVCEFAVHCSKRDLCKHGNDHRETDECWWDCSHAEPVKDVCIEVQAAARASMRAASSQAEI